MKTIECDWCEGSGDVGMYSCCGDDMSGNDIGLCPTCCEHWGYEHTSCDNCGGTGKIDVPETPEEIKAEEQRVIKLREERHERYKALGITN